MKAAGFIGRVIVSGGTAAITSAIVAAVCSRLERRRAAPPLNAVSHILWGGPPPADAGPAGVNMAAGLVLHAGAAAFWATPYELLFGRTARRSGRPVLLLGDLQSVVHLDTEVPHSRFKFGMPKQQLHRMQVLCTAMD